jgi:hypothetical protein
MTNSAASFFEAWHADRQTMKEQTPDIARAFGGFCAPWTIS